MFERLQQLAYFRFVAAFHADDALPDRWQHLVGTELFADARAEAEPFEPRRREHRRVEVAGVELAQACLDVAAQ